MIAQQMQLSRGETSVLQEFLRRARLQGPLVAAALAVAALFVASVAATFVAFAQAQSVSPEASRLVQFRSELRTASAVLGFLCLFVNGWMVYRCLPSRNDRLVLALRRWVRGRIDPQDQALRQLSDEQLRSKTEEFRQRLSAGQTLEQIRDEAYAVVREASRRAREHRQFECQVIGGQVLEHCNIAEMKTGEGKTIVCYFPAY
ncbi:MAG: hypothetical protein ACE5K7_02645, partial [Phycisphaerae bacterium]